MASIIYKLMTDKLPLSALKQGKVTYEMIEMKEYDRLQIAEELGIKSTASCDITKKLKSLGYQYETSGRGASYKIRIIGKPQITLKNFAEQHLGIKTNEVEALAHFLHLLFTPGENNCLNYTPLSLSYYCTVCDATLKRWMDSLKEHGILIPQYCEEVYTATKKVTIEEIDLDKYKFIYEVKYITREEYVTAYNRFYEIYNGYMKDIETNLDMIPEMALSYANTEKRRVLDWWWPYPNGRDRYIVNPKWNKITELYSLLEEYKFEDYNQVFIGSHIDDNEQQMKKWIEWWSKLNEKREKFADKVREEEIRHKKFINTNIVNDFKLGTIDEFIDYIIHNVKEKDLYDTIKD